LFSGHSVEKPNKGNLEAPPLLLYSLEFTIL
jgi:hypothetical protein